MLGMLVEKVSSIEDLVQIQLRNKLHVGACLKMGPPHLFRSICLCPIDTLPS